MLERGYVQVYTGEGKGKTTAALGLGLRGVGRGLKVKMYQFLKGTFSGELASVQRLAPDFEIRRFAQVNKFFWKLSQEEKEQLKEKTALEFQKLAQDIKKGTGDIIILDEIMGALHNELLSTAEVCQLIKEKPAQVELILTGRYAPQEIVELADLVTEMKPIKHYLQQGVWAREGIEN